MRTPTAPNHAAVTSECQTPEGEALRMTNAFTYVMPGSMMVRMDAHALTASRRA